MPAPPRKRCSHPEPQVAGTTLCESPAAGR
jgi:hypothetical protein